MAGLGLMLVGRATAYTFTSLHSFTGNDGNLPHDSLVVSSNTLYGTTYFSGVSGPGTIFAINTDGTGFTNLHNFTGGDGANPYGGIILSGNILYGTTTSGGVSGRGTVFAIHTDGTGFTNLYSFTASSGSPATNSDGTNPTGSVLALLGNTLFGTTVGGGLSGCGTIFAIHTDGTGFTNFHNFTGSDRANPEGGMILLSNTLYGTTYNGGVSGLGTVFAINTDGSGFTNLHNSALGTAAVNPIGRLSLSGGTLYGTGLDSVFAINTDGSGFTNLHHFTSNDGNYLRGGLILSGNTLYGTASMGGAHMSGTVFKLKTDGTGFTTLYSFSMAPFTGPNTDGAGPFAGLTLSSNTLYGTTRTGGSYGYGTVFSLSFGTPQVGITLSEKNVILTWPTNATWFTLQSATNIDASAWNTVSPAPVVVNGQNTVTNLISDQQKFYRLSQ